MYNVCTVELLLYCTEMAYMCTCKPRLKYPEYCTWSLTTYLMYLPPCTTHLGPKLCMLKKVEVQPLLTCLYYINWRTWQWSCLLVYMMAVQVAGFHIHWRTWFLPNGTLLYMIGTLAVYICTPSQLVYIHFLEPLVHNGLQMYNGFLTCVGNHSFNRLGNKNLEI